MYREKLDWHNVISDVKVEGLEDSVIASKYPMATETGKCTSKVTNTTNRLASAPMCSGHSNFLKGVSVRFDLTFSVKAWTEIERYAFLTIISSQSTMHCLTKFNLDSQFIKYTDKRIIDIVKQKVEEYNTLLKTKKEMVDKNNHKDVIDTITKDLYEKRLDALYSCPTGIKLTAKVTTNYMQLKTIYKQRRSHVLPEWQAFCDWVETLPYFNEWILDKNN